MQNGKYLFDFQARFRRVFEQERTNGKPFPVASNRGGNCATSFDKGENLPQI